MEQHLWKLGLLILDLPFFLIIEKASQPLEDKTNQLTDHIIVDDEDDLYVLDPPPPAEPQEVIDLAAIESPSEEAKSPMQVSPNTTQV